MSARETLRLRIANPHVAMPDEYRREGEIWLHEQDAIAQTREDARYRTIRWWTIAAVIVGGIAAFTGFIAAVTGVFTLFR